ncbi:Laccase-15 [Vitis vinifera]|uniref:Laccase-15 n=1 Tax=Vitis vinifera TaxID=29760 RepID=A0A438BSN4_VITVI|nr:Laccase-15 [Vitis vinifera]
MPRQVVIFFDNTTTTAIIQYRGYYTPSSPPFLPHLPAFNDTIASLQVMATLRSLADVEHPCNVPLSTSTKLIYTLSINSYPCVNDSCSGANGTRSAANKFPSVPPVVFDFTAYYLPLLYQLPSAGTEVRVLEYNSTVEIVLQGTNLVAGGSFALHLVDPPHQNTISVLRMVGLQSDSRHPTLECGSCTAM